MPVQAQLHDGRILEFPDGTDPQVIQATVRKVLGVAPETTFLGQTKEAFKGLIPGAVGLVESAAIGASALLPEEQERAAREAIARVAGAAKAPFAPAPGYEESIIRKGSEAVGSTVPFLLAGPLGWAGRLGAVGLGVGAGAGEARTRAEAEGATEEQRGTATALGTIPGALEIFAPFRILSRIPEGEVLTAAAKVKRVLQAAGEEAAQEAASGLAQNMIARGVYKPEQELIEGLGEQAAYGGATGAIVQGLMDLALGRRARGAGAGAPAEGQPEELLVERLRREQAQEIATRAEAKREPINRAQTVIDETLAQPITEAYPRLTQEIETLKQQPESKERNAAIRELEAERARRQREDTERARAGKKVAEGFLTAEEAAAQGVTPREEFDPTEARREEIARLRAQREDMLVKGKPPAPKSPARRGFDELDARLVEIGGGRWTPTLPPPTATEPTTPTVEAEAPAVPAVGLTEQALLDLGLSKRQPIFKRLLGKEPSDESVLADIENYLVKGHGSEESRTKLTEFKTRLAPQEAPAAEAPTAEAAPVEPTTPYGSTEFPAAEAPTAEAAPAPITETPSAPSLSTESERVGAGVPVAGGPAAVSPAEGVGAAEPVRVVPPVEDAGRPAAGEGEQPAAVSTTNTPESDALMDEIRELQKQQQALLTKAGRMPTAKSPARKKWDELGQQIEDKKAQWAEMTRTAPAAPAQAPAKLTAAERADLVDQIERISGRVSQSEYDTFYGQHTDAKGERVKNRPESIKAAQDLIARYGGESKYRTIPQTPLVQGAISDAQLRKIVADIERALGGEADITILDDITDFDNKQAPGSRAGALRGGKIYLFRSGIADGVEGQKTIFHEVFHKGLANLLPPAEYRALMTKFYNQSAAVRQAADAYLASAAGKKDTEGMSPEEGRVLAVEEALAEMAEATKLTGSTLRQLGNFFARVADRIGMPGLARAIRTMGLDPLQAFIRDAIQAGIKPGQTGRDRYSTARAAKVTFRGDRGVASNESVTASLRVIDQDDDIALEDESRVGAVMLENIYRLDGGQPGRATELLQKITKWADDNQKTLVLMPSGEIAGSRENLKSWYARNGFVEQSDGAMVRKFKAPAPRMKAAAFRSRKSGEVIETGPVHNRYKLPGGHASDLKEWEAGFVDTSGKFYNREEAARAIGADKKELRTEDFGVTTGLQPPTARFRPGTSAFKRWFGDSKVVDKNGGPLVVYHGTRTGDITVFDPTKQDPRDAGFWFGTSQAANQYAASSRGGGNVMPTYLRIVNPKVYTNRDVKITPKIIKELEAQGYDGILRDFAAGEDAWRYPPGEREWAVFRPDQIKSATGNVGAYGQRPVTAEEAARVGMTEEAAAQAQQAGDIRFRTAPKALVGEKEEATAGDAIGRTLGERKTIGLRAQTTDSLAGVEAEMGYLYGGNIRDNSGNMNPVVLLSQALDAPRFAQEMLRVGTIVVDPSGLSRITELDYNGQKISLKGVLRDIAAEAKRRGQTPAQFVKEFGEVLAGRREYELMKDNDAREVKLEFYLTPEEAEAANEKFNSDAFIKDASDKMDAIRFAGLDFLVATGRMSKDKAKEWKEATAYTPFKRIEELDKFYVSQGQGGVSTNFKLAAFKQMKEFKGSSERQTENPIENFVGLMEWMTREGMKAEAVGRALRDLELVGAAKYLPRGRDQMPDSQKGAVVSSWQKGQEKFYYVPDPANLAAFVGAKSMQIGSFMRAAQKLSQVLRVGVTITPAFAVKQIADDITRAYVHSGVKNPMALIPRILSNMRRNWWNEIKGTRSPGVAKLAQHGVVPAYDTVEGGNVRNIFEETGISKRSPGRAILRILEAGAKASDVSVRQAIYDQTMKETGDVALAESRAREIINFSRRGASTTADFFIRTIPFFNAYARSMDKLLLAAGGGKTVGVATGYARNLFFKRMGILTAMGLSYALLMSDDEEYQNLSDHVRDRNWVLPYGKELGYTPVIPLPPELSFFFKAIPERVVQYYKLQGTPEERDALRVARELMLSGVDIFWAPNLTPQLVKPFFENLVNYSFFLGRPLESQSQLRLDASRRFGTSTSEAVKASAEALAQRGIEVSPIKIENAIRGVFGMSAGVALSVADVMVNPTRTDRPLHQHLAAQLTGASAFMKDPVGTRFMDDMYDFEDKVAQAYNTYNHYVKTDPQKADAYLLQNYGRYSVYQATKTVMESIRDLNKEAQIVDRAKDIPPDERRQIMNTLRAQQNELAQISYALRRQAQINQAEIDLR